MKKILKALIALVIIGGLAFGVYMLFFNNKTDNGQIYAKVTSLNSNETFTKVNETIYEMLTDIESHPEYELDDIHNYLTVYVQVMQNYELVRIEIINNGLFVNKTYIGDGYKQMNSAYDSLISVYKKAESYLKDTYWVNQRKTYIENFYITFKNALINLNSFYYNAGTSVLKCIDNTFSTNNHYKLEMEYYLNLSNNYVKHYIDTKENAENIVTLIEGEKASIAQADINSYIENKQLFDNLYTNAGFDKKTVIKKYIKGELDAYLEEITDETKKIAINNYCDLIVRG